MICVASLETQVVAIGANMKEQIARRGDGVARAGRESRGRDGAPLGRGAPKSRSQASEAIPITQERPASRSRNSTARTRSAKSAQNERTAPRLSSPGFIVTTRKIAARVSGADTGCATTASVCEVLSAMRSLARVFHVWTYMGPARLQQVWQTLVQGPQLLTYIRLLYAA